MKDKVIEALNVFKYSDIGVLKVREAIANQLLKLLKVDVPAEKEPSFKAGEGIPVCTRKIASVYNTGHNAYRKKLLELNPHLEDKNG